MTKLLKECLKFPVDSIYAHHVELNFTTFDTFREACIALKLDQSNRADIYLQPPSKVTNDVVQKRANSHFEIEFSDDDSTNRIDVNIYTECNLLLPLRGSIHCRIDQIQRLFGSKFTLMKEKINLFLKPKTREEFFHILTEFLNSESHHRNSEIIERNDSCITWNCYIRLMIITAAGLTEKGKWNDFLTKRLYDPRLLIFITSFVYMPKYEPIT